MSQTYFGKELLSNSFIVSGAPVPFEALPGNHGVIALESPKDDALIAALNEAATAQRGGIYRMSETEYAAKKAQAATMPSLISRRQKEMLRPMPKGPFDRKAGATAAPANPPPPREALPLTNSALKAIEAKNAPPTTPSPEALPGTAAPTAETPAPAAPVEGFRPATRRISRKPAPAQAPTPAQ